MLRSNELRVGNIIFLGEVEVTVGGWLIGLINSYERGDANELGVQEPSGIPLTEEWFSRFQLNYRFENDTNNGFHFHKENQQAALVDYEYGVDIGAPCKYVHQLQNLYFAITGTELTIKEPVNNIS